MTTIRGTLKEWNDAQLFWDCAIPEEWVKAWRQARADALREKRELDRDIDASIAAWGGRDAVA